jgi:hypothetical protein
MGEEKERIIFLTNIKLPFSYGLFPFIYNLMKQLLPLVTPLKTWTRLIHHGWTRPNPTDENVSS